MCSSGNHVVGQIGAKMVRLADWDREIVDFEAVIDDFNVRGQRDQINHPGWVQGFRYCTDCGGSLAALKLRSPEWKS